MIKKAEQERFLSIGKLAAATGISPDRLRIWERRYGYPTPVRLPSGHRRYPQSEVTKLRWVSDLVARGGRPSELVGLSQEDLRTRYTAKIHAGSTFHGIEAWIEAVETMREDGLRRLLSDSAGSMSRLDLLEQRLTPVLVEVGANCSNGRLEVRHEQFVARVFNEFLRELRHERSVAPIGLRLVLTTVPGETQGLSLAMLGTLAADAGVDTVLLGPDTPVPQIVEAVRESASAGVAISVSRASRGPESDKAIRELRDALPFDTAVLAMGEGMASRRGPRGVRVLKNLRAFVRWIESER